MAEKDMKALADRMERMAKRMEELLAAYGIKLQSSHAEGPSCPEVIHTEEQPTKATSPSPLENLPELQPTKEIPTPPPSKEPETITVQTKDQPSPSPQTPPPNNPSAQTLSLPKIPAKAQKNDTSWPTPEAQPPPSPPKILPSSPTNKSIHHPQCQSPKPQSPATLSTSSSTPHHPYLKTTHCQPQTKRTKPKKPPPQLKPYPFHTDWSRRRKRARFKTRHFLARRKPLAVSKFDVNRSVRGKKDPGLGKRGPKKKRQVRRDNVRGFKVPEIQRLARKRLGEQTRPWLRSQFTGRRQGTGLGRMGSEPENPMKCGSPPDGVSGHRRPPSRPPDGDYAKDRDFSMKSGSPDLAVQNMEFFRASNGQRRDVGLHWRRRKFVQNFWRRKTEDCTRDFLIFWAGRGAKSSEEGRDRGGRQAGVLFGNWGNRRVMLSHPQKKKKKKKYK